MREIKNNKCKRYAVGIVEQNPVKIKKKILNGKNFSISFKKMPDNPSQNCIMKRGKLEICPNVVIHAINKQTAFDVLSLIVSCLNIVNGHQLCPKEDIDCKELGGKGKTIFKSICTGGVYRACIIATKASYRLSHKYAIHKLNHSYEIFSLPFIEYDPFHSDILPKTAFLSDYIKFENAIVLAYSSIEELGLQISVNEEHPYSRRKGVWDEVIKLKLKNKLREKKIPLREKVIWMLRGKKRFLDQKFRSKGQFTPWTKFSIRDKELNVMDAICEASFLRSRVSSHASSPKHKHKLVKCLMPYDVANVQFLSRHLLLSNLEQKKQENV